MQRSKKIVWVLIFTLFLISCFIVYIFSPEIKKILNIDVMSKVTESSFERVLEEKFVLDPDVGRFPGESIVNEGAEEFLSYTVAEGGAQEIRNVYEVFRFDALTDYINHKALLYSEEGGQKEYTFDCADNRTFSYKSKNYEFLTSGFDFLKTVATGDTIFTKCKNEDCSVLGPDCIILKRVVIK